MKRMFGVIWLCGALVACTGGSAPDDTGATGAALSNGDCETLLAGQNEPVGEVCLSSDGENIFLDYTLVAPWVFEEIHTWIGTDRFGYPKTKKGSPIPGQFPVKSGDITGASTYHQVYPMPVGDDWCGDTVYIATHAAVKTGARHETAWPHGYALQGANWAMGLEWVVDCGEEPPGACETAFAWRDGHDTCFLGEGFNRWGWTNAVDGSASFQMPLLAGAAHCNESADQVGTVTFSYAAGQVTVTYAIDAGWDLEEAQLYAGADLFPSKNGTPTVAPGQYPVHCDPVNANGCTETFPSSALPLYVIAHATVCPDVQ